MAEFVCLGDATQDNFFFISDADLNCDLKTDSCELILRYGQKIPVERLGVTVGGNAANVSAGLAKLGLSTKLVTTFGDDERGVWLKRELMRAGVDVENSAVESGRTSNMSGIIIFKGERTILTYHSAGADILKSLPEAAWLYLSSSSGRDSTLLHQEVLTYLSGHSQTKLAMNPATADLKLGRQSLAPLLARSALLILNWEEAETLLGAQKSKDEAERPVNAKQMLAALLALGPKVVALTDGRDGAYAATADHFLFCPAAGFDCLEPTGAGDAFSSGFLAGFHYNGEDLKTALLWGIVNSGSVITKVGGQEGLMDKEGLAKYLQSHPDFGPKEI